MASALLALALLLAATGGARAQEAEEGGAISRFTTFSPRVSFGAYGGLSTFGSFLEQGVGEREREVTAGSVPSAGVSAGFDWWRLTGIRTAIAWSPGELEFEDETGDDGTMLDRSDVGDFDAFVFTLELVQFLFDESQRVAPYAMGGLSWTLWNFDRSTLADDAIASPTGKDTFIRRGETASIGVQVRAHPDLLIRVEFTTARLGNPFDGNRALQAPGGETFNEPSKVSRTTFGIGVVYHLGEESDEEGGG